MISNFSHLWILIQIANAIDIKNSQTIKSSKNQFMLSSTHCTCTHFKENVVL